MILNRSNILILVPAFNEEGSIAIPLKNLKNLDFNVLVIDDGSTDATAEIARSMGIPVISLPFNLGVGGALRAGFQYARKAGFVAVVQIDADGQHPVGQIDNLIKEANSSECHMVLGSRFISDETTMRVGHIRRLPMRLLAKSASRAAGVNISDSTSGFRLIRQPLLEEFAKSFPAYYLGDTYEAIISAGKAGYIIREIPASLHRREVGNSSASAPQAIKLIAKTFLVSVFQLHFSIEPLASRSKHKNK